MHTPAGDFYGRPANLNYYRKAYFQQTPPAQLSTIPRAHHLIGNAAWVEYDLKIVVGQHVMIARGTALCHRSNGAWRIVHLNHSTPPGSQLQPETAPENADGKEPNDQ